jgi:hypothetical protein
VSRAACTGWSGHHLQEATAGSTLAMIVGVLLVSVGGLAVALGLNGVICQ